MRAVFFLVRRVLVSKRAETDERCTCLSLHSVQVSQPLHNPFSGLVGEVVVTAAQPAFGEAVFFSFELEMLL